MKRKRTAQSGFFPQRVLLTLLLWSVASWILGTTMLGFFRVDEPQTLSQTTLTFAQRVTYQRAIENVHWRHRIWPKERPDPKPSLDAVISQAQLEKKVADYLRKSEALKDSWQRPITAKQLQAEMDRMAHHTRQPEVLRELFEALGNDPFVIAECLARPLLAERLVTNREVYDQTFEVELKQQMENNPDKAAVASPSYVMPVISGSGCIEDSWAPTNGPPDGRKSPTAVWTGTEMIIWGGVFDTTGASAGGKYNPATDSWTPTGTINEPSGREGHTAVWTGTEMIVWGGTDNSTIFNTGARYSPVTNTWTATSTSNAPTARQDHTAVWTGSEMIIWGGWDGFAGNTVFDTGGRYNPNTDSWTATSTANAPAARAIHTAVWTGSEMVAWGGRNHNTTLGTGGRYNPGSNSWVPTSTVNAPVARVEHTAVWTGTEMVVWGGTAINYIQFYSTGGRYNPSTNSWTSTSAANVPSARIYHTAVWTGNEMIVWGGGDENFALLNTGGRYNPVANNWTNTSTTNAPDGRLLHSAVWTGSEMIVWGGGGHGPGDDLNTGGRYNPVTDGWTTTTTNNVPTARDWHTAVWTGSEMIVWGGDAGDRLSTGARDSAQAPPPTHKSDHGILGSTPIPTPTPTATPIPSHGTGATYDPSTDNWTPTSTSNAPSARVSHTAVWTGSEMIVWGGFDGIVHLKTGGRYNPATNSWTLTSMTNVPETRSVHTAVWSGSEMIVWGGFNGFNLLNNGGGYNASTDTWRTIGTSNVPTARAGHTAIWTGSEMIVWGGQGDNFQFLNTGGKYNPSTDTWAATTTNNAPSGRDTHTAIWTGSEMMVWGGRNGIFSYENTGGRYNPITDVWLPTSIANAPSARAGHTAVWTGREMIVWAGGDESNTFLFFETGGRYDPTIDSWISTSTIDAPSGRQYHTALWTGGEMIVWGGEIGGGAFASSGGRYCARGGPTPTPNPTATPTATPRPVPSPRLRPTPQPRP
jgi:N-acetylneuraminic acid mutarotase